MYQSVFPVYDVAIIGGGPCGLAVAARLREPAPSALFTDIEHARFWGRKHDKNTVDNETKRKRASRSSCGAKPDCSIIVFDAHSDKWMSSWQSKFKALRISHLRSPLFFHPDPQDRDGLLAFSHFEKRTDELCEIQNVVGREISKHRQKKHRSGKGSLAQTSTRHLKLDNRDQNDYFTPSASLFDSYIDCIVERYGLEDLIHHTQIVDLSYDYIQDSPTRLFRLKTTTGQTHLARTVVLASGPMNIPQIPLSCPILSSPNHKGSAAHIFDPNQTLIPPHVQLKHNTKQTSKTVVVGGGLTSAQVVDLLLTSNPLAKVYLVLRSRLKVKHFDVDLPWVAKLRNREMATFWSTDTDEERFEMLKTARNGGSITPGYEKILRAWEKKARLNIYTETEIDVSNETIWDEQTQQWSIALNPSNAPQIPLPKQPQILKEVDHIIFATSIPPSIHNTPFLNLLMESHPIADISGLPVLTHDLMWNTDVPLFATGALAGLRLGPGAGNLAGARLGAERIVWGIEDFFARNGGVGVHVDVDVGEDGELKEVEMRRDSGYGSEASEGSEGLKGTERRELRDDYRRGLGSQFRSLALLDD